ncbi:MAG: hypothetical protein C0625_02470 [Arcobacter sp.]|nr:MAG: hypothetical protein C0625_02470 [Arcobacter sp.]
MSKYIEDLVSNYHEEDYRNKIVFSIMSHIKQEANFEKALQMMIDNNLTLEDVITRTCRLDLDDISYLADLYINKIRINK